MVYEIPDGYHLIGIHKFYLAKDGCLDVYTKPNDSSQVKMLRLSYGQITTTGSLNYQLTGFAFGRNLHTTDTPSSCCGPRMEHVILTFTFFFDLE